MIDPKEFAAVAKAIVDAGAYQAVKYISPKLVLKATRRHKPDARATRQEFVFTMGRPAYNEAAFIKKAQAAGLSFPIKKVVLKFKTYKK